MLSALKFVKGAVGKKDLIPALTHFHIKDRRVTGFNGKICLSAPIPLDIDCCPKAIPFIRAIEACDETAQLHLTPTGRLAVRSGKFRAHVDTVPQDSFPSVEPEGLQIAMMDNGGVMPAMRALYEFTADDASKQWSNGVLLDGESAYATNNVILAQFWLGCHFPYKVNVPRYAIKEMLRINEEPVQIQLTENSITFHYEGDRWLRSQLIAQAWPDIESKFALIPALGLVPPVAPALWAALATLAPFLGELGAVYLLPGCVATAREQGASVDIENVGFGIYNHTMLSSLEGVATSIGFSLYPAALPWYGDSVRGLIIGMREQL